MNKRVEIYFRISDDSYKLRLVKSDNKSENKNLN
jgi:hypothetical protein